MPNPHPRAQNSIARLAVGCGMRIVHGVAWHPKTLETLSNGERFFPWAARPSRGRVAQRQEAAPSAINSGNSAQIHAPHAPRPVENVVRRTDRSRPTDFQLVECRTLLPKNQQPPRKRLRDVNRSRRCMAPENSRNPVKRRVTPPPAIVVTPVARSPPVCGRLRRACSLYFRASESGNSPDPVESSTGEPAKGPQRFRDRALRE
jgi:hypothetical protein